MIPPPPSFTSVPGKCLPTIGRRLERQRHLPGWIEAFIDFLEAFPGEDYYARYVGVCRGLQRPIDRTMDDMLSRRGPMADFLGTLGDLDIELTCHTFEFTNARLDPETLMAERDLQEQVLIAFFGEDRLFRCGPRFKPPTRRFTLLAPPANLAYNCFRSLKLVLHSIKGHTILVSRRCSISLVTNFAGTSWIESVGFDDVPVGYSTVVILHIDPGNDKYRSIMPGMRDIINLT
ncbi:uncharacterized protein BYT42DRAFT_299378 [Radiomyces spectabilis]|uniref:uncharacterized protein n=1 Tax=Radiomyces spectabilis TaxID=64574 RepID=UPI00221EFA08|nr:uncharacterized protein BYT42DRAFT_299378 [Radiomyces spectabilis]KAI8381268.1 hypothetical protein BYT42DRAFT_299378 [Radiomyces spectabilis]